MQTADVPHYLPHSIASQSQSSFPANMARDAPSLATKPSHATFATTVYSTESDTETIIPSLPTIIKSDQYQEETGLEKGTTSEDIDPPPDGGLQAWMTVLGCSLVSFSTFGFVLIPLKQCGLINSSYSPQNRKCIWCFQ